MVPLTRSRARAQANAGGQGGLQQGLLPLRPQNPLPLHQPRQVPQRFAHFPNVTNVNAVGFRIATPQPADIPNPFMVSAFENV